MSKNINRVFCHRGSGASYVIHSILSNYICDDFDVNYWHYDSSMYKAIQDSALILYVVRDGRDVLVEMYDYFRVQPGTKKYFENKNFRQYLMGHVEAYMDKELFERSSEIKNPLNPRMFSNPVEYWVEHVQGYIEANVEKMYFVNYDMMLIDAREMLMHIGTYFNLEARYPIIESIEELILYKPIMKELGKWRSIFQERDLQYFWGYAEELMVKLKFSYT